VTNINSPGFTKSSRGSDTWSDNLTVADPSSAKLAAQTQQSRTSSKSRFAEHLASTMPKPGALAPPAAQSTRHQQTRPSVPAKQMPAAQEQTVPAQKNHPRSSRPDNTPAPWERAAPAARPGNPIEAPTRMVTPRPAPETLKGASSVKPTLHTDMTQPTTSVTGSVAVGSESGPAPTDSTIADTGVITPPLDSSETDEDWQQALQAMMAAGSPELFMQQSPALALLAGRLEFLEPAEIPALVSQSPLLQAILSHPQTADLLQTAMPLEENLQALGLAPNVLQTQTTGPVASVIPGNQPSQPIVKLADTLQALGFDVQRMIKEGDLLKDNISLDGLQPYMQRAERLQSTLGLPVEWPTLPTAPVSMVQDKNPGWQIQDSKQALDPALMAQLSRLAPQNQPRMETVQLWSQIPEQPGLVPLTVLDDGSEAPVFLDPKDASPENWNPFAENMTAFDTEAALPPPSMDEVPLIMNVLPRAPAAAQDPFLAMAQRWNAETLQTLRPEDFVSRERMESTPEMLTSTVQPMRSLDDLLNLQLIQPPDLNNRMDSSTMQDNPNFDINTLSGSLQDLGASSHESGGDFSGRNPDQSFLSQDSNAMFAQTQGPTASNKAFSIETAATQAPSAPVSPQQMQNILDNSSMLIKEGGGSIRLDLGSKDMGPLDLALDIQGNTVELRIVTHSDQAREALVQELPRLRESLQNQNLNLEKVEIGLSYGSAWSQSSGNGQQNREQFFENTSESSSRGPQGINSSSRSYRQSFVSTPEPRVPLHNGLIQVRV